MAMLLFILFLCGVVALCLMVIWAVYWAIGRLLQRATPFAPFAWTGIALIGLFLGAMGYGYYWGRFQLEVKPTTYSNAALPEAFDGYKIVHISDLHLSSFGTHYDQLQRLVDSINAQAPDLICFTGDLVGFGVEEALPYTAILRQLHAKDGVVSVLGNHDFALYALLTEEEKEHKVELLTTYQRDTLGWHLLRNESYYITRGTDALQIIGVDNTSCQGQGFQTNNRADLSKAMNTPIYPPVSDEVPSPDICPFVSDEVSSPDICPSVNNEVSSPDICPSVNNEVSSPVYRGGARRAEGFHQNTTSPHRLIASSPFQILLSHDPSHWQAEVVPTTDIPLTLSGHTHAGQFRVFGYPLSSLMFKHSEGWYAFGKQDMNSTPTHSLYINTGIGCTLPVRIGVPMEITVIELKRSVAQ